MNQPRRGKKAFENLENFIKAGEEIVARYRVKFLIELDPQEQTEEIHQRRYGERPEGIITKHHFQMKYVINQEKLEEEMEILGW